MLISSKMKCLFTIFFALTISSYYSQDIAENRTSTEKIYQVADKMPEFPGGMTAMIEFISENLHYPSIGGEKMEGTVFIKFVVDKEGNVKDVGILNGMNEKYDKEALRVISDFPTWAPGENEGVKVNVQLALPIKFKI